MTRTARRSQRRSSLPATPWSILKRKFSSRYRTLEEDYDPDSESASEATSCTSTSLDESDSSADHEMSSCSPAFVIKKISHRKRESDLKETKKTKLNGSAAKRFFQKIKQKLTTRRLRRNLQSTEVAPLLSEDSYSGSSDGAGAIPDKKSKQKKAKKTKKTNGTSSSSKHVPFTTTDTKLLLADDSEESDEESSDDEGEEEGEEFGVTRRNRRTHKDRMEIGGVLDKKKRQNDARRLRRQRQKVCFNCRQSGHLLSECPKPLASGTGICFKCGSASHTSKKCRAKVPEGEYPYAKCFICQEVGHLSSACPDNPRGLYPHGGCCKVCGSVEHLKSNCPERLKDQYKYEPWGSSSLVINNTHSLDDEDFKMDTSSTATSTVNVSGVGQSSGEKNRQRPKVVNF